MTRILSGVLLVGTASLALGALLFRGLGIKLDRTEEAALGFAAGSACFSQLVFFLCVIHVARASVFIAVAAIAVLFAIFFRGGQKPRPVLPPLSYRWRWFFGILFLAFGIVYLVNAMAPEMSPDGSAYHLPIVARYLRAHGFIPIPWNFYASFPEGIELLFLPAVSIGGNSAAAMAHFLFLLDLPLLMICYGRRFGFPVPAAAAAFLVFASPVVGLDGTTVYIDVAVAAILFALFYLLRLWSVEKDARMLIPIGILAGFAYAAKYTAAIAVPYALGFVIWKLWRSRKPILRPALTVCALAAFFILPWMIKDALFAGNPLAPFANRLFPNPYVHVSFEHRYREQMRHYLLTSYWSAPWDLTVNGEPLQGFFGPVFLLAPLALFGLRRREARPLLLAGAVFALPWFANIGTRFLIPALPFFALALTLVLARPSALLLAVVLLHAFLSWRTPRIAAFPWRAALRIEPEETYLARNNPGYNIDRMIEKLVPPGEKVFSFAQIPEAWTTRTILVSYNSAENETLADMLWTPLIPASAPDRALDFRFPERQLRRIRVLDAASVSELQIFDRNTRLPPAATWHFTARPNPWDAPLAFDNKLITRWRSWQHARPGMFVEADFGEPKLVDEVRLITASDAGSMKAQIEGINASGVLQTLPVPPNLRQAATRELLAHGIRYLLIAPGAFGANDFNDHPASWGMRLIGESGGTRLYELGVSAPTAEAPAPAPVPSGAYDDSDARIVLRAAWSRDTQFLEPYRHTITYSNIPGSAISLTFTGNEITYVHTRAANRGIAEVRMDGAPKGRLDLYSAETKWRTHVTYSGLAPGQHTIEIRVTGEKNPRAADCFVDLDEFIVK